MAWPRRAAEPLAATAGDEAFELSRSMWNEIVEHARQESPRECCGLIAGRDGRAARLFRLTNLAPGNSLYEIDPREIYELEFRTLPEHNLDVVAIYHSHPITEAYPSPTDLALAFWPDAFYVICSLARPSSPVIRAFRLANEQVEEALIQLLDLDEGVGDWTE